MLSAFKVHQLIHRVIARYLRYFSSFVDRNDLLKIKFSNRKEFWKLTSGDSAVHQWRQCTMATVHQWRQLPAPVMTVDHSTSDSGSSTIGVSGDSFNSGDSSGGSFNGGDTAMKYGSDNSYCGDSFNRGESKLTCQLFERFCSYSQFVVRVSGELHAMFEIMVSSKNGFQSFKTVWNIPHRAKIWNTTQWHFTFELLAGLRRLINKTCRMVGDRAS